MSEPSWREVFLDGLREGLTIAEACKRAGVSRTMAYKLRGRSRAFAEAWVEAIEEGTDRLEAEAYKRALRGSDALLIFLLKARRPHIYRERYELSHTELAREHWRALERAIEDMEREAARREREAEPGKG